MKNNLDKLIKYFVCFSVVVLAACGGGGGGDSSGTSESGDSDQPASEATLSGIVADGYLRDARVFLDRNGNGIYDNGEPMAQSTSGGLYSLAVNPGEGDLYPVIAEIIAGQTVDEDTGIPVMTGYYLESLPGRWEFISPLTTLVKVERDKNPLFTEQQAVLAVRTQLGLADDVSLFVDYMATGEMADSLAEEYARTHKAARIVANLMGALRGELRQNLGGQIVVADQVLVAYMISDKVFTQAGIIKQALDDERNSGTLVDVAAVAAAASADINMDDLNIELLSLYRERIEQNLEFWDMQPPQLLSQLPSPDDSAPVTAAVVVTFDEALDETMLFDGIVELSGPHGTVSGTLTYDVDQGRLTFVPVQSLLPLSSYRITLSGQLTDSLGNPLGDDVSWSFTTIFDEIPPPLPDF